MADRFRDTRGGYGVVNKPVMIRKDISAQAKGLYALLCTYAGGQSVAWPGQTRLAEEMATSDRTVRRWIEELQSSGVLYVRHIPVQGARIRCEYCLTDSATTADIDVHGGHWCPTAADTDVLRAADTDVRGILSLNTINEDKHIQPKKSAGIIPPIPLPPLPKQEQPKSDLDTILDHWYAAHNAAGLGFYKTTKEDRADISFMLKGLTVEKIKSLIDGWFAEHETNTRYHTMRITAFAKGYSRVAKSTKSSKDVFNKVSGWEGK